MANDKDFKIKNGLQVGGAYVEKVGTVTGNADVDLSTGNVFDYTPTANATFTFSNAGATEHSFVLSVTGDEVAQGYDLANASYDSVSFSVSGQESIPVGLIFKPDGTKMYILGFGDDEINEYDLSTAWDITTASFVQNFSVAAQDNFATGIFFKEDGLTFYVTGYVGQDVNEYSLSTAWDISTASYVQNFSIAAQNAAPSSLFFKPDGTRFFLIGGGTDDAVYEYDLTTPWDISTASYTSSSFSVATQETTVGDIFIRPSGDYFYVIGEATDTVYEYLMSTPWSLSSASYTGVNFSVSAQEPGPRAVSFKDDGTKMYVVGADTDTIYQYSTAGTPAAATLTYPSSVKFPSGTAPAAPADGETDILEFSTTDGGTTWYGVRTGDAMA